MACRVAPGARSARTWPVAVRAHLGSVVSVLIDLILAAFQYVILGVLWLFPEDDTDFMGKVGQLASNMTDLNYFLPIEETFVLVVSVLVIFPIFAGVSLSLWILAQLRGSSSRG